MNVEEVHVLLQRLLLEICITAINLTTRRRTKLLQRNHHHNPLPMYSNAFVFASTPKLPTPTLLLSLYIISTWQKVE